MSGLYGLRYVKFHFCPWAGWALLLSCGGFFSQSGQVLSCLLTVQIPYLSMGNVGREDPALFRQEL